MVKRPSVESASDEDEPTQYTSQKRARFTSDDDEVHIPRKRKTRRNARESDDEDDMEEEAAPEQDPDEDEDEELSPEDQERIKREYEEKRKIQGKVAEYGIIQSIEMHHFMCHKFLTFDFGPQINFIIGHNGSGKSAVLSAITIALGGKSLATGRGSGLKSFIREGMGWAEVTISLKNRGDEAFKSKVYGHTIYITRKWFKEGSSTWKIMNWEKKLVSSKREELAAICDHMNIQVDNPMSVLTQDSARQFLSASSPTEKYQLFLRGTQLSQLSEEYETCAENIAQTTRILEQKKEAIPDLKVAFKDASTRYQEAQKALELQEKASSIKRELAWAHVATKQQEMTDKFEELANLEARLPEVQSKLKDAKDESEQASGVVRERQEEYASLGRMDELTDRRNQITSEMKENKRVLHDFNGDLKRMNQNMDGIQAQLNDLEMQIATETERMQQQTQAKQEESQQRLHDARQRVQETQQRLKELEEEFRNKDETLQNLKREGMKKEAELNAVKGEIKNVEGMIKRAQLAENDAYAPYGVNIRQVLAQIDQMRWHGEKPLGPLGLFVNAKDPEQWGTLLRHQLSQFLTAFAVTDPRDQVQLRQLLAQSNNKTVQIIIYDTDLFDYSSGEPPADYLTVLRALEITNPYVERILINRANIERVVLGPRRKAGEGELRRLGRGGVSWTADGFIVRVYPEGGTSSSKLNFRPNGNTGTHLLLTGRNSAAQLRHLREEKTKHEQNYQELSRIVQETKTAFHQLRKEVDGIKARCTAAADEKRRAQGDLNTMQQEINEEMPSDVSSLESARDEAKEEKATLLLQCEDVLRQKAEVDEKQKKLLMESNELKRRMDEHNRFATEVHNKVEDAQREETQAQQNVTWYTTKLAQEQDKIATVKTAAEVLQEEFESWTTKAQTICEEVENPRPVATLQRQLESVEKALKLRVDRGEKPPEELAQDVNDAEKALKTAERDYKQMVALMKALKVSLTLRLSKWQEFRRHIALRCKEIFSLNLSVRGYFGKVLFHHDNMTLKLKVQTTDQVSGRQTSKQKDPRSLSGGEKSFSTICLLLALWEAIGCPLRCLDEFDVFMDAVNRRIAMKMMIDMANSSDQKQYILITPQEMGNVTIGPTVKVNRMMDPERSGAPTAIAA